MAGGFRNFGFQPAHDTTDSNGPGLIADHEGILIQYALDSIQGGEFFALFCPTDDDFDLVPADIASSGQKFVIIERVQRLTPFEHDIVGDVHQIVNRALAHQLQAMLHPERCGLHLHIPDDGGRVPMTEVIIDDFHIDIGLGRWRGGLPGGHGDMEGSFQDGCDLPGHADDRSDADHVGGDVDIEHHIPQIIGQGCAYRGILGEDDDAFVLVRDAQLSFGTHHALGEDASDFPRLELFGFEGIGICVDEDRARGGERDLLALVARLEVGRAGDHGQRFPGTVIHGDQGQAIRVGVFFHPHDLTHKDFFSIPGNPARAGDHVARFHLLLMADGCRGQHADVFGIDNL